MSCFYWLESSKWCILKTCYTVGCQLQRFRHYFTDGLNQSLISSVAQTSLLWELERAYRRQPYLMSKVVEDLVKRLRITAKSVKVRELRVKLLT